MILIRMLCTLSYLVVESAWLFIHNKISQEMKQETNDYMGDTEASYSEDELVTRVKSPKKRRPKTIMQKGNEVSNAQKSPDSQPDIQGEDEIYRPHYKIVDSQVTDVQVKNFTPSNFKIMAGPAYNEFYQNYLKGKRSSSSSQESVIMHNNPEETSTNETQNEKPYAEFESTSFSGENSSTYHTPQESPIEALKQLEPNDSPKITDQEALTLADLENAIGNNSEEDQDSVIENKTGEFRGPKLST